MLEMLQKIDFRPGKIIYDDLSEIDPSLSFEKQQFSFKEDLLQVDYDEKYVIDIGWKPDFEKNGKFKIVIIKNLEWESPIYFQQAKDLKELFILLEECSQIVRELLKNEK